jgi:zeta-carotene desaturase
LQFCGNWFILLLPLQFRAIANDLSVPSTTLGIVGGGLAGIAAAESALTQGWRVALFERSGVLGGRGTSLLEPTRNQWIDTGQHLILGCCTELRALNRRLGLDHFFHQSHSIPFVTHKQQRWSLVASSLLPQRWQLLPSFLTMPLLPMRERLKTGRLLRKLCSAILPDITIAEWFKQHHVSQNALDAFWSPLILSAVSEMPEHSAAKAVQKVIREGFHAGREAMSVHIPTVPLREIYHDAASKNLAERGMSLHCFKRLRRLHWTKNDADDLPSITALEFSDGTLERFDRYILAIPAFQLWKVLEASGLAWCAEQLGLERFEPGAITTVHLWLDRPVLPPEKRYCALTGGIGQFLCTPHQAENYHTVVVSAAHRLLSETEMTMHGCKELAHRIVTQLRESFGIPSLHLLHCRTTTCFEAVFSPRPAVYDQRPESKGLFTNGAIAGDWTKTDLPATMEGAVRSGLAATSAPAFSEPAA